MATRAGVAVKLRVNGRIHYQNKTLEEKHLKISKLLATR